MAGDRARWLQGRGDPRNAAGDGRVHRDGDRVFVGGRRFQRGKLAVEQADRHEMAMTGPGPLANQLPRAFEINQPDLRAITNDNVAIAPLQRRTGDHPGIAPGAPCVDPGGNRGEPRGTVLVVEWMTGLHLRDVLRWMQGIAFLKKP